MHRTLTACVLLAFALCSFPAAPSPAAIVGTGDVSPTLPWSSSTIGYVGKTSDGDLTVNLGSTLSSSYSYLGYDTGSTGTATVTGPGSKWTNSYLYLGNSGTGTLTIEAGGLVSNTYGYLGYYSGSTGTATVTGAGSKWNNSGALWVGYNGTGTLTVNNGGEVSTTILYASLANLLGNGTIMTQGAMLDADLVFDAVSPVQATVSFGSGGSLRVIPSSSVNLGVGYKGEGTLRIVNGIAVSSSSGYLGYNAGSTGTATVTGAGSKWANASNLYVGNSGAGALRIEAGGQVNTGSSYLGYWSASGGTATVTGTGSTWTNTADLYVGRYGNGNLTIEAGGRVSNSSCRISDYSASFGTVTVTGAGSKWTNSSYLYVGELGTGMLEIKAGGQVSCSVGNIGYYAGSTGTVMVTGEGSTWTNTSNLYVGHDGNGTLKIEAGGQVISGFGFIGGEFSATGNGAVTVTGAGSKWSSTNLFVHYDGTGTLTVDNGGTVTAGTIYASLANLFGNGTITTQGAVLDADLVFDAKHPLQQTLSFGSGGALTVNPSSSGNLGAGYEGTGTLRIADGIAVSSGFGYLGYQTGATGTATITGVGSTWINGNVTVGESGTGTLTVEAGAQVSSGDGCLADQRGATGTATVTGIGSKWISSSDLCVGYSGTGTLKIDAGGQVSDTSGHLGMGSTGIGTATVTGEGSKWINSGDIYVGEDGTGMLTVENGGTVIAGTIYASLANLFGNGTITTQGAVLDTDLVFDVASGAQATVSFGSGGSLTVDPSSSNNLGAGYKGTGALRVANGIAVSSSSGILGYRRGSTGAAAVTGAGSTWTNSGTLNVGYSGTGTLTIEAGGQVSSNRGYLGFGGGSTGAATVTGAGSRWSNSGDFYVGTYGTSTGTLTIEAGGQVSSNRGYLGYGSSSTGTATTGTATVTGTGSKWTNVGDLYVGNYGAGTLTVKAGGHVSNGNGYIGYNSTSIGTASVTGAGSTWTNGGDFYVGNYGTGTLAIEADGQVSNGNGYIGYNSTSTGTATVTGAGSTWTNSSGLYVGRYGKGTLMIAAGGIVTAKTLALTSSIGSVATCVIDGGTLQAGTIDKGGGTATLTWNDGTIRNYDAATDLSIFSSFSLSLRLAATGTHAFNIDSGRTGTVNALLVDATTQGTLTKIGAGTLILTGLNTFTGDTTITAGTLQLGYDFALQSSALGISDAGLLTFSAGVDWPTFGGLVGSGNFTLASNVRSLTLNPGPGATKTYSGILGSATAGMTLTKTGQGTQVLSGSNTYTGTTTIAAGTLSVSKIAVSGGGSSLGNATNAVILDNQGTLLYTGAAATYTRGFTVNAGGGQLLNAGTGTLTIDTGDINVRAGGLFTVGGESQAIAINTTISGFGGLVKTGGNTVLLNAANSFSGATTVAAGTLSASNIVVSGGSNLGSGTSTVILGDSTNQGTLLYTGAATTYIRGFTVNRGGGQLLNAGTGTLTVSTGAIAVAGGGLFTVGGAARDIIINSKISGVGGLVKTGADTVILSAVNSFTGTTTIAAGTLSASKIDASGGGSSLGYAPSAVILGDSTNQGTLSYTGGAVTYTRGFTANAGGGQLLNAGTGTLTVSTFGIAADGLFTVGGASQAISIDSIISGRGRLSKTGGNTVTLTNANTYSGDTTITAGTLQLGNNLALQNSALDTSGAGALTFSSGVNTPTFGGLVGSKNLTLAANVTALTLNPAADATKTYSGILGSATAGMKVTKTGLGTQILSGANTYSGATTINQGTLVVNGSLAGAATVNSGGTLGGGGTIAGVLTVNAGGTLAPGNSPGILTVNNSVTFAAGSNFIAEVNGLAAGSGYDQLRTTGPVTLGGTLALSFGSFAPAGNDVLFVIDNTGAGTTSGTFQYADDAKIGVYNGLDWYITYDANNGPTPSLNGGNDVAIYAVPEPGTLALLAVGLLGGLAWAIGRRR